MSIISPRIIFASFLMLPDPGCFELTSKSSQLGGVHRQGAVLETIDVVLAFEFLKLQAQVLRGCSGKADTFGVALKVEGELGKTTPELAKTHHGWRWRHLSGSREV
jgi:hypothetical protein